MKRNLNSCYFIFRKLAASHNNVHRQVENQESNIVNSSTFTNAFTSTLLRRSFKDQPRSEESFEHAQWNSHGQDAPRKYTEITDHQPHQNKSDDPSKHGSLKQRKLLTNNKYNYRITQRPHTPHRPIDGRFGKCHPKILIMFGPITMD
jgi:hypothetical protein